MITAENRLLVKGYCGGKKGLRWDPDLGEMARGGMHCLAICDTERVVIVAVAITVTIQADQGSLGPEERVNKGAILIYRFPIPPNNNPTGQPRFSLLRLSLDAAPDFVSFDPLGLWLVCITKIATTHTVRVWSLAEEVRLWCSVVRNVVLVRVE